MLVCRRIGALIDVYARDDCGLWVQMGGDGQIVRAPLSPGTLS